MKCFRCGVSVPLDNEKCYPCFGPLCADCWEKYGHCGKCRVFDPVTKYGKFGENPLTEEIRKTLGELKPITREVCITCGTNLRFCVCSNPSQLVFSTYRKPG